MDLKSALIVAIKGIMMHRMRAFLTILGIIFGIASVISMVTVSEGAKMEVLSNIEELGINNIYVRSQKPSALGKTETSFIARYGINKLDAGRFAKIFGEKIRVVMIRDVRHDAYNFGVKTKIDSYAVSSNIFSVLGLKRGDGAFFTQQDEDEFKAYCVVGSDIAKLLYPAGALGEFMKIKDHAFKIVGVLDKKEVIKGSGIRTMDLNKSVLIPFKSWENRIGALTIVRKKGGSTSEYVAATDVIFSFDMSVNVLEAGDVINEYFTKNYPDGGYKIIIPYEILQQREEAKKIFTLVMVSISSLALIVGGIGIMNIMLASILERIKEIGTRRALGATKKMILTQFLSESVVLSVSGGILGIVTGIALSYIISAIVDWKVVFTLTPVVIAFVISVLVGVVFGTYPAMKAANLNPIEALRSE